MYNNDNNTVENWKTKTQPSKNRSFIICFASRVPRSRWDGHKFRIFNLKLKEKDTRALFCHRIFTTRTGESKMSGVSTVKANGVNK